MTENFTPEDFKNFARIMKKFEQIRTDVSFQSLFSRLRLKELATYSLDDAAVILTIIQELKEKTTIKAAIKIKEAGDTILEMYQAQLKRNIDELLGEKTSWGRVELKQKLYDLIDKTGEVPSLPEDDDIPF